MHTAYLLLGSNKGNRKELLNKALQLIEFEVSKIIARSEVYESPPWGFEASTSFYNQAVAITTPLAPLTLLEKLLNIETRLGRMRLDRQAGYESRTIDIDILLYDDSVINTPELTIPHPRLHLRRFALTPLAEIAPQLPHPLLGKTIAELLETCPDNSVVCKIK